MLYTGEITHISVEKKEVRVRVDGYHSRNILPENYPVALITSPLPLFESNGFNVKLYTGLKVLCDFIDDDKQQPVIISFLVSDKDISSDSFQQSDLSIKEKVKQLGIDFKIQNGNVDQYTNGDQFISLSSDDYKSLLQHLADVTDKINEMITAINSNYALISINNELISTHIHTIISPTKDSPTSMGATIGAGQPSAVGVPLKGSVQDPVDINKNGDYNDKFKRI